MIAMDLSDELIVQLIRVSGERRCYRNSGWFCQNPLSLCLYIYICCLFRHADAPPSR